MRLLYLRVGWRLCVVVVAVVDAVDFEDDEEEGEMMKSEAEIQELAEEAYATEKPIPDCYNCKKMYLNAFIKGYTQSMSDKV